MSAIEQFNALFQGKSVSVIGVGVSNRPLIHMLVKAGASVVARDRKEIENKQEFDGENITFVTGDDYLKDLKEEVIFKTPGMRFDVPELAAAVARGSVLTSEMEVFFDLCPSKNMIAITGSDGKTTTTTLTAKMLEKAGYHVFLGGNIGAPLLPQLAEMTAEDFMVLELSSFQLHTMKKSPRIAVMTNITPNHLDMHKSYQEYIDAKCNIYRYQDGEGLLIVNRGNEVTRECGKEAKGRLLDFSYEGTTENGIQLKEGILTLVKEGQETPLFAADDIAIPGRHNVENYMAAILAVSQFVTPEVMKEVAQTFQGVEHRLQLIRTLHGVRYYNSSIDSSPNRTKAALSVFNQKVILLCGGKDKGIPYDEIGAPILDHVKKLLLIGMTAGKIEEAVLNECQKRGIENPVEITHYEDYPSLVKGAQDKAEEGDIVLLSPASTSFDLFKNFMQRGEVYASLVNALE